MDESFPNELTNSAVLTFGDFKDLAPILEKAIGVFTLRIEASGDNHLFYSENAFILSLITRKKEQILACIEDDSQSFAERFETMGKEFYQEKIPYIDFVKSFSIFKELLIETAAVETEYQHLIKEIYFLAKMSLSYTSRGYLLSMVNVDIQGIKMLIEENKVEYSKDEESLRELLEWFYHLLLQIQKGEYRQGTDLGKCDTFLVFKKISYTNENKVLTADYLEDMHKRLYIDAQSILFFLEKEDYASMLPVYSSLLNIYKVSLYLMNNHQMKRRMELMETREREQQNLQHKLENLVEQRTRELSEANHAKSIFLANMSHEIRTPINAIMGFNELLWQTSLSDKQREYLEKSKNASGTLLSLISDILDLSKIEAGKLTIASSLFRPREIVRETVDMLQFEAKKRDLGLSYEVEDSLCEFLIGDAERIRQVLINLTGNALKFTKTGSVHISLSVRSLCSDTCTVEFAVTDTGIGIDTQLQESLFDLFFQVDNSTNRNEGGTGLGLAISKQLIEAMGGSIEVESEEGEGSTFSFILTLKIPDTFMTLHKEQEDIFYFKDLRALVVEDNDDNREVACGFLRHMGVEVDTALNGEEGINMIRANGYDFVLMDIQMPVMDGLTATRTVRDEGFTTLPIIALSAYSSAEEQQRSLDAGMNAHLKKPFQIIDIQKILLHYFPSKSIKVDDKSVVIRKHWIDELSPIPGLVLDDEVCSFWLRKEDFLQKFELFIHTIQSESEYLHMMIREKDISAALRHLHKLKGSVKLYGAKRLALALVNLENALQEEQMTSVAKIMDEFDQAVKELGSG